MYTDDFLQFLGWERVSRDTIDFKRIYVDMADDVLAGLMLSQIVFWYTPNKETGHTKLRVFKDGQWWIAKSRDEWWQEIRLKPREVDRAISILVERGIIVKKVYRFNNLATTHIRLDIERFLELWSAYKNTEVADIELSLPQPPTESRIRETVGHGITNPLIENHESVNPLTETTTEKESTSSSAALAKLSQYYTSHISITLSHLVADKLKDIVDSYPSGAIDHAISEAIDINKHSLSYLKAILETLKANNYVIKPKDSSKSKNGQTSGYNKSAYPTQQVSKPKTKKPPVDREVYRQLQEESRREIYSEDNDNYATRNQGKPPTNPD